jgi:hypothetical protein
MDLCDLHIVHRPRDVHNFTELENLAHHFDDVLKWCIERWTSDGRLHLRIRVSVAILAGRLRHSIHDTRQLNNHDRVRLLRLH